MPDGVILDTKDSLMPTDTTLDQGYINVQFKTVIGRKMGSFLMEHTLG